MELRQLRYFVAVYTHGSLSRAALGLFVTQPALSRQMRDLERECGVELFERVPSGVVPTAAGRVLFRQARQVLALADALPDAARGAGPGPESVVIGLAPGLPPAWIGELLTAVRGSVPHAVVDFLDATSADQLRMIREGRIDIGLAHQAPAPGQVGTQVRSDGLGVALMPQDPLGRGTNVIRLADLDEVVVLAHSRDQTSATHDRLVLAADRLGISPSWRFASYTENAEACARAAGARAAVMTATSAARLLPDWRWLPLAAPAVTMPTFVVRQASGRHCVRDVVDAIAEFGGTALPHN
jgi:LysR family transcriptional regulator, benzoate and cis,cis-muconate-responsive activator of ben and cat genes